MERSFCEAALVGVNEQSLSFALKLSGLKRILITDPDPYVLRELQTRSKDPLRRQLRKMLRKETIVLSSNMENAFEAEYVFLCNFFGGEPPSEVSVRNITKFFAEGMSEGSLFCVTFSIRPGFVERLYGDFSDHSPLTVGEDIHFAYLPLNLLKEERTVAWSPHEKSRKKLSSLLRKIGLSILFLKNSRSLEMLESLPLFAKAVCSALALDFLNLSQAFKAERKEILQAASYLDLPYPSFDDLPLSPHILREIKKRKAPTLSYATKFLEKCSQKAVSMIMKQVKKRKSSSVCVIGKRSNFLSKITESLAKKGVRTYVYDLTESFYSKKRKTWKLRDVLAETDVIVLTSWDESVKRCLSSVRLPKDASKVLVDCTGFINNDVIKKLGLEYASPWE